MIAPRQARSTRQVFAIIGLTVAGAQALAGCADVSATAPPPAGPISSAAARPSASGRPHSETAHGPLSLDTPIEKLCAVPAAKAVLDQDLPGLTTRPEFGLFKSMSLKQLQPMSKGQLTRADLAKVKADLAALNTTTAAK
jgi:hypothetical protein